MVVYLIEYTLNLNSFYIVLLHISYALQAHKNPMAGHFSLPALRDFITSRLSTITHRIEHSSEYREMTRCSGMDLICFIAYSTSNIV